MGIHPQKYKKNFDKKIKPGEKVMCMNKVIKLRRQTQKKLV